MEEVSEADKPVNIDNIEWLRARGVQIDIPASRQKSSPNPINHELDRPITIVKIPFDTKKPYEEVTITINDGSPGDQLLTLLKPFFIGTGTESISSAALQKASEGLLHSTGQPRDTSSILDKSPDVQKSTLLNMFENQGHVELFSLTHPSASNNWKSVVVYLDEGGQLKGLPLNPRAASIAAACGYEGVSLAGDVFVGRRCQEGTIRHVSLRLDELESSASWMKTAHQDNYARGAATGQVSMDSSEGAIDKSLHCSTDPLRSYEWNQDEDTVDVCFKLPAEHRDVSKKCLCVEISASKLLVTRKAETVGGAAVVLLELELFAPVKVGDSSWGRSGDSVEFSLEKAREAAWPQLEA